MGCLTGQDRTCAISSHIRLQKIATIEQAFWQEDGNLIGMSNQERIIEYVENAAKAHARGKNPPKHKKMQAQFAQHGGFHAWLATNSFYSAIYTRTLILAQESFELQKLNHMKAVLAHVESCIELAQLGKLSSTNPPCVSRLTPEIQRKGGNIGWLRAEPGRWTKFSAAVGPMSSSIELLAPRKPSEQRIYGQKRPTRRASKAAAPPLGSVNNYPGPSQPGEPLKDDTQPPTKVNWNRTDEWGL